MLHIINRAIFHFNEKNKHVRHDFVILLNPPYIVPEFHRVWNNRTEKGQEAKQSIYAAIFLY